MRRQITSFALMVCGALALALGLTVAPAPASVAAMPALQPSPRPTLQPTPDFIPHNDDKPTPVRYGRITGTVIDTRTGAPAANMLVMVGDSVVLTDANGNYDSWVPVGSYRVALQLREGEGFPVQEAQEVGVTADGTTVMHLFFTSPAPVVEMPTAVPTPTAAPTPPLALEPEPPASLPAAPVAAAPTSLPDTAAGISVPGPLMLVGALLFGLGALLQLRPRRRAQARAEADARMLRRMLVEEISDRDRRG